jgi:hypothetical protein
MRHAVTKLGTLVLYDNWKQHLMNKAEAWYNQARVTYKDQYRKVTDTDMDEVVEFNSPAYEVGEEGDISVATENSIADLPRARVYVTLRKDSPTQRIAEQSMLYDVTKILSAHPELFQSEIRVLTNQILRTIELDPAEKRKIEMNGKLKEMRDVLATLGEIEGIKANTAQAMLLQEQVKGMLQQMAQQMGAAPGGPQGQPGPQPSRSRPEPLAPQEPQGVPPDESSPEQQYQQIPQEEAGQL